MLFLSTALAESNKAEVLDWTEKKRTLSQVSRHATATTLEGGQTYEYIVDVPSKRILKKIHHAGFQAGGA